METPDRAHLVAALATLEAAGMALRERAEAAEKRAEVAETERLAAVARAHQARVERDEATRRAATLQTWLDAAQLELAGRRALADLSPETHDAAVDRRGAGPGSRQRGRGMAGTIRLVLVGTAIGAGFGVIIAGGNDIDGLKALDAGTVMARLLWAAIEGGVLAGVVCGVVGWLRQRRQRRGGQ